MSAGIVTGTRGRLRTVRAAACLLLAAIALDLLADTRCDVPSFLLSSPTRVGELSQTRDGSGENGEACATYCVPDCFCCSRSTLAGPAIIPPEPGPLMPLGAPAAEHCSEGVRPVVDRPPLSRA